MAGIDPDYVDVAERIREFYTKHPTGSLQALCDGVPMEVDGRWYIKYVAAAYRTPDDPCPGVGTAWEPVPGPTPFTKNSELQNAETSAWGRAIIAVGIPSKKIATAQDIEKAKHSPVASGPSGNPPTVQAQAPATGETPTIQSALDMLITAIGKDNAKVAYDLALHNAGVQPGTSATKAQTRQIISTLTAATGAVA